MASKNDTAIATIEDLKKNHKSYYDSLYPECQNCQNILSSYECDCCEDFDMYCPVKNQ